MFEIHLNGMVYEFSDDKMAELSDILDMLADAVHEE